MLQTNPSDPYNLQRFIDAQAPIYDQVLDELRAGQKRSHWMWFIFPQISGLGSSSFAVSFSINSVQEAETSLSHPILGPRLRECTRLVNQIHGRTIDQIFGSPDNLKFRSSMTLFSHATYDNDLFLDALRLYFNGESDPATLRHL